MLDWSTKLAAGNDKKQIVLGLEPTGHYWFCLTTWLVAKGISVVQVNPYAVKQTKEVEDNRQLKDDRIRNLNRIHREMKIYFLEYKDAFGKIDGAFSLELLKAAPFPDELAALGTEGMIQIWHEAKLRGRGNANASSIMEYARKSVGINDGADAVRQAVKWFVSRIIELDERFSDIEKQLNQRCMEILYAKNILAILGIGENILSGILAEMGDISGFDNVMDALFAVSVFSYSVLDTMNVHAL